MLEALTFFGAINNVLDQKMIPEFFQNFLSKGQPRNSLRKLGGTGKPPKSIILTFID